MRRSGASYGEIILLSNTSSRPASVSEAETNRLIATTNGEPRRVFGVGDGILARRQTGPIANASCQVMMTRHACG